MLECAKSAAVFLAICFAFAATLHAKETEPGQETVWDEIMHEQSIRGMRTGAEYMDSHEYDKAAKEFAKSVLARPNDPDPHLMLGAAYYWNGQVEPATSEFREALRLDSKNAQGHLLMGIVYAWKGDVQAAYQSFLNAEKYAPNRSDIEMNLGSVEETLGRYPQALDHLRKAVSLEPQHPLYHFQLGMLYSRLGRNSDAADSLKQAINKYPEFEDAALELGAVQERQNQLMDALAMYSKAVHLKSRDAVARLRLGRAFLLMNNPQKAREIFRDAFHVTPDESGGGLALSVSFGGKPPENTRPSSDSSPHPASEAPAPQPNDPLDVVARNLERIPLDQDATLNIQMAFLPKPKLVRSEPRESASSLKRALEEANKPVKPSAMGIEREFNLRASNGEGRAQQIQKAIANLREAMNQAPADAEVRMGMQLNYNPKNASSGPGRADSENAPKVSYQPRQVGNDLGLWVVGTGWMALVEEILPEDGEPPGHQNAPLWWVTDGLAYASLGDGTKALDSFNRALESDAKEETALLGRAVAFVEMGREPEAIEAYRRLLAVYPKNRIAKDGLAWLLRLPAGTRLPDRQGQAGRPAQGGGTAAKK